MSAVSAALRHPGVRLIGGGWAFFITENVAISQNRDWIIQGIGTSNYYRMYVRCYAAIYHLSLATYWLDWLTQTTLDDACPREVLVLCLSACPFSGRAVCARQHCSRATCSGTAPCPRVSILYGYFRYGRQQGPRVWSGGGAGSRAGSAALQALGLVGLSQLAPALQVPLSFGKAQPLTPSVGTAGGSADDGGRSGGLRLRCPMDFSVADVVSCSSRCRDVGC
jgi:hypothetical protein